MSTPASDAIGVIRSVDDWFLKKLIPMLDKPHVGVCIAGRYGSWDIFLGEQLCPATHSKVRMFAFNEIWIKPEHRHKGIFSGTLQAVVELCRAHRIPVVQLNAVRNVHVYRHALKAYPEQVFVSPFSVVHVNIYVDRQSLDCPDAAAVNLATNGVITSDVLAAATTSSVAQEEPLLTDAEREEMSAYLSEFSLQEHTQAWMKEHNNLLLKWSKAKP